MINYNTLTEDFDYNELDIKKPEQKTIETIANSIVGAENIKIPLNVFFGHFFNSTAPAGLSDPLSTGAYYGWQNPDNKKPVASRPLIKNKKMIYFDDTELPDTIFNATSPEVNDIQFFRSDDTKRLLGLGFKILCNRKPFDIEDDRYYSKAALNRELIACINDYINYITGQNYNFMNTLYGQGYNKTSGPQLYYKIFVSPDKGFILVDHIIEYDHNGISYNYPHAVVQDVPPISMAMGALIFTNLKTYNVPNIATSSKRLKKLQYIKREEEFVAKFDLLQYLLLYEINDSTDPKIAKSYIRHDKTGHIWYSAAAQFRYFREMPEIDDDNIVPSDLTKELDVYENNMEILTPIPGSNHDKYKCCMMHKKIRGYTFKKANCGYILYFTNDPEWCEKFLGPGAAEYIKTFCGHTEYSDELGKTIKLYSFIWYNDNTMEVYDKFMDNPDIDLDEIKRMCTAHKIKTVI